MKKSILIKLRLDSEKEYFTCVNMYVSLTLLSTSVIVSVIVSVIIDNLT